MAGIVAHRGASGLRPENTLAAFSKALEIGVNGIELDVQLSADGAVVVHHDLLLKPEIARDPRGRWLEAPGPPIGRLTLEQLKAFDVGRLRPGTRYARRYPAQTPADGERIPTLDEVVTLLDRCGGNEWLWIELKTDPTRPEASADPAALAEKVVGLVERRGFVERTILISFDWRGLLHVRRACPQMRLGFLTAERRWLDNIRRRRRGLSPWTAGYDVADFSGSVPRMVAAAGGTYWSAYFGDLRPEELAQARDLGLGINAWTLRRPTDKRAFVEAGVDFITTDRPDWFV